MLGAGVVLCVPAAVLLFLFTSTAADAGSLRSALRCETDTQAAASSCLSLFTGQIRATTEHYKALTELTIALDGSTVHVGYDCWDSVPGACSEMTFAPGTHVVTEWWKGQVVMLGSPGSQPAVLTDQNPEFVLDNRAAILMFAIPGVALVLWGLLLLQAPATADELGRKVSADWRSPQPVSRLLVWRVAWGSWSWAVMFAWFMLYLAGLIYVVRTSQYASAALIWSGCGVVAFVGYGVASSIYLTIRIQRHQLVPVPSIRR